MSEISLRDYFVKLEQLLNTNAADEVIHHCRHILQYYPKNVAAYRYLGRALLVNGRWDEATAALRRVLSVIPDDYAAHVGLSEIYDHKKKADEAIWHLERAFEQNPNNSQLLDGIRALYHRYRDVDQAKVQLTAAAVARQALRNQSYEHAIDTLRDALERQPDRIDLRLLLALALWESGDHVEAAEAALDVLQLLPDCLEANRILTMLWLEEDRPSDAQRYLNRVEAIDPYIAVEVAQGQPASDDAFRLDESDYVRSAQSELTVNRPDWLQDITAEVPQADTGGEDWSNFMSSMLASSANAQAQAEEEKPTTDLFGDEPIVTGEKRPASSFTSEDEDIPAEFAALPAHGESSDDLTTLTPTPAAAKATDPNDPMAWLHGSGVEMVEDEFLPPFEQAEEPIQAEPSDALTWLQEDLSSEAAGAPARPVPDSEAFSWMQNYDMEMADDVSTSTPAGDQASTSEEEMPGWLKDEGFLEEALGIEQLTGNDQSPEPEWLNLAASKKETADLPEQIPPEMRQPPRPGEELLVDTDWLKDVSQDEPQPVPGPRRGLTAMLGEANFDWLQEQPTENDLASDVVMDEWLAQFGASDSKAPTPPPEQDPQWLTELDTVMSDEPNQPDASEQTPDWLSTPDAVGASEPSLSDDEFSWLSSDSEQAAPVEVPDWLAELQPATPAASDDAVSDQPKSDEAFDWSVGEVEIEESEPSKLPDWMAELEPTSTYETPSAVTFEREESVAEGDFEWLPEGGLVQQGLTGEADGEFAWLDEVAMESQAEISDETAEPAVAEDMPDWVSSIQPHDYTQAEAEPAASSENASWSNEIETEAEFDLSGNEPVAAADVPDWLSELQPQPQAQLDINAEPVAATEDFGWLDEDQPEAEVELSDDLPVVAAADVPDWLSELQPQPQAQPDIDAEPVAAAEDDDSWLDEDQPEAEGELELDQPVAAAEVPDWLSELQPQPQAQPDIDAEPVAATEDFGWLDEDQPEAEVELSDDQPVVAAAEVPDWLSELQPQPQAQPDIDAEPVAAVVDDDAWLDDEDVVAEPVAELEVGEVDSGDYDWLDEIEASDTETPVGEASEVMFQPQTVTETGESAAVPSLSLVEDADDEDDYWLNDEQAEFEIVTSEQPSEDDINEFEGMTVFPTDEMDIMRDESFEPVPASNAPDWLNAMVPGLDVDFEAAEDEPLETEFVGETPMANVAHSREFDWVEEIIEEESRQPETTATVAEPARPRYIFSRPPTWLNEPTGPTNHDDELPDWPSDVPEWLR